MTAPDEAIRFLRQFLAKREAAFLMLALALVCMPLAYAQDYAASQQIKTLRGQISQINWASSSITVRWLQTEGYVSYDEITLFAPDRCQMIKGTRPIGFTDLQIGDQVTVEYVNTSPGPLKIVKMTVVSS